MSAYWLTFKPLSPKAPKGWPIERLQELLKRFQAQPADATEWWRIAAHSSARIGERVYLFKQGDDPRGIFGIGRIVGGPELRHHGEGTKFRVFVHFEKLVDPANDFLLRLEDIADIVPKKTINAQASGTKVSDDIVSKLEARLATKGVTHATQNESGPGDDAAFDPDSVTDERQQALRAIQIRRGQPAFRTALLNAYSKRCVVTGCGVEHVLEAAHITPHLGPQTNHVSNGLLMRADIHTLFDCDLIAINPDGRTLVTSTLLKRSSYASIEGRLVRHPSNAKDGPSAKNLEKRFAIFQELEIRRVSNSPGAKLTVPNLQSP